MDILLLKELQGGSNESLYEQTQADRAERFGISTNAIQARIHALEDGKEILGHHVKINIAGRGRTAYDIVKKTAVEAARSIVLLASSLFEDVNRVYGEERE